MGTIQIKKWYNCFKDDHTSVESDACSGRPSESRNGIVIGQVKTLPWWWRIVKSQSENLQTRQASAFDLFIPFCLRIWALEESQHVKAINNIAKATVEIAQDMLETEQWTLLNIVVTGDESWAYRYNPETKLQLSQWKHPIFPRQKKSKAGQCQNQSHADRLVWPRGHGSSQVCMIRDIHHQGERLCITFMILWDANGQTCRQLDAPSQ